MNSTLKLASLTCIVAAGLLSGCADFKLPVFGGAKPAPATPAGVHPRAEGARGESARGESARAESPRTESARAESAKLSPDQAALKDGIDLYNNGDYNAAIKRLGTPEITSGPKATQLAALKYTAFSYCVTSRPTLCRQQFKKALKLDPGFDLAPGEYGHPLWGPVFTRAKKGK